MLANPAAYATWARYYYYLRLIITQIIIIISSVPAAVRRRFAGNAAHFICCARCTPGRAWTHGALIRNSPAQARIHMTRGWAVESGGSTSCVWKEGGNAACSALVNCPTVHEAAKWDSPHCPRQWRR